MINHEELIIYQNRIETLKKELAGAKLTICDLERQLIFSLSNNVDVVVQKSTVDNSAQYDVSDFAEESPVVEVLTAEMIAEAAEQSVAQSSYVYDPATGMYYDHYSKCYYDAEKSLFYEPNSGIYYKYNEGTRNYEFHSHVNKQDYKTISHIIESRSNVQHTKKKTSKKIKRNKDEIQIKINEGELNMNNEIPSSRVDVEEGEIVSDEEGNDDDDDDGEEEREGSSKTNQSNLQNEEASYIPCIRVIVKISDHIKTNSLFILTCKGGTIGREETLRHNILIPDPKVSKMHCSINYDESLKRYVACDQASVAGTFINGKRIGQVKTISPLHVLYNLDTMQIGGTTFELHIHPRGDTCSGCELWNLSAASASPQNVEDKPKNCTLGKQNADKLRREQLNRIKKKYGLKNMNYEKHPALVKTKDNYKDRALARRKNVGSDNPYVDDITESASVNQALPSSNVGHKIMLKMGWKTGESLGKEQNGIAEPINVKIRANERAGLGTSMSADLDNIHNISKLKNLMTTRHRYVNDPSSENNSSGRNYDY